MKKKIGVLTSGAPHYKTDIEALKQVQRRKGSRDCKGCGAQVLQEQLRELGFFSLQEKGARGKPYHSLHLPERRL